MGDLTAYQKVFEFFSIDPTTTAMFAGMVLLIIAALKTQFSWMTGWKTTVATILISIFFSFKAYGLGNLSGVFFSTLLVWLLPVGTHEWVGKIADRASAVVTTPTEPPKDPGVK